MLPHERARKILATAVMTLILCEQCQHHVRSDESTCPFCRARSRHVTRTLGAAALLVGAGLSSAAGCERQAVAVYGPPPMRGDPTRVDGGQLGVWVDDASADGTVAD